MSDLTKALREAGHEDVAAAVERRTLAGQLREAGRPDLADALEAGPAPVEEPQLSEPPAPAQPHELLAKQLDAAQSKWHTLGGGPGDGPAAA